MAVQVWIGEKPENPNERRALTQLAAAFARLDGLYIVMANFSVGGRTLDVVVLKHDGIFVVELKYCDGKVIGDVNGPWFVESANKERKRINPGRKNPYNQVLTYYYAFSNFLDEHRSEIAGNRNVDVRSIRRIVAIAPYLHPDSQIDTDWKVQVLGFDALALYVFTERSPDMQWSDAELLRIPHLLNCTRWEEIEQLVVPDVATPPKRMPAFVTQLLSTWTGQALIGVSVLFIILAVLYVVNTVGTRLVTLPAMDATPTVDVADTNIFGTRAARCTWLPAQTIARLRGSDGSWQSVAVGAEADALLTLTKVDSCDGQLHISLTVLHTASDLDVRIPLDNDHISIRDSLGTRYELSEQRSNPTTLAATPNVTVSGNVTVLQAIHPSATSLIVTLKGTAFGDATWLVPLTP
ncbi:MAG: hypothetical protein RLY87_1097 [Chloroflexota bacterium]|jgi:hypothetical protein